MFDNTATVFTIHNVAYQGRFPKSAFYKAEIREIHSQKGGLGEYEGDVNFLKTAIFTSDIINTVSNTYAQELLTPAYGEGMQDFLSQRSDDFYGIINGIDYSVWGPGKRFHSSASFFNKRFIGKLLNKNFWLNISTSL